MREGVPGIEDLHEEGSLCGRIMISTFAHTEHYSDSPSEICLHFRSGLLGSKFITETSEISAS